MSERTILKAEDGMVLTDGINYGKIIYLAEGMDAAAYHSITQEQYEEIVNSGQAEEEDYQSALSEFGVMV